MTLSKQYLLDTIERYESIKSTQTNKTDIEHTRGIIYGLKIAYTKLTSPVEKSEKTKKPLDIEKLYEKMLKYYIDEKGFDKDNAHRMALTIVEQQKEKHGIK